MEEDDGRTIYMTVKQLQKKTNPEPLISSVRYDRVTLRITWIDGPEEKYDSQLLNKQKELILIEDYFYRAGTG
jgi:hypothetical protein